MPVPGDRRGGMKDQCFSHRAPCDTQSRSTPISRSESFNPDDTGGIRIAAFVAVIRGTTSAGLIARVLASGPWHPKHLSDKIGRTSRLNESSCADKLDTTMSVSSKVWGRLAICGRLAIGLFGAAINVQLESCTTSVCH